MPRTTGSQAARRAALAKRLAARPKAAPATIIDAQAQQAWRAVRQLTKMLPTFTAFARMATGNKGIRVQLGKHGAQTDGKTIWVFPPIALGEERVHERHLCDKRGADKRQLCKACDAREVVLFYLYHEIAHIAFESTAQPLQYVIDRVVEMIQEWHPAAACSHAEVMVPLTETKPDYINLVSVHNSYLPILLNAIEDARVNSKMFRTRPGLKVMFEAGTQRVFEKGVEHADGEYMLWNEAPYNSQVIIGLFLIASGYGLPSGYLAEEVVDVLRDPTILKLMDRVGAAYSVHQIAEISLDTFARLNEMGFCLVPKCEVQPPFPSLPNETDDEEKDANQEQTGTPPSVDPADACPGDSPDGDASEDGDDEAGDGGTSDSGSSAGDSSESSGGGSEPAGHQQDAGDDEGSDAAESDPEETGGAGESDEDDDESSNDSGGGNDPSSEESGGDDDEDSSSVDDVLRGTGDIGNSSEGEDGAGSESHASGAGDPHSGDEEDRGQEDDPSEAGSSSGGEEDSSDDEDDLEGESGSDESPTGHEDSTDDDPEVDDNVRDVSENVWNEPDAGENPDDSPLAQPEPRDYGSPADVADIVKIFGGHLPKDADEEGTPPPDHSHFDDDDEHEHLTPHEQRQIEKAVEKALAQSAHFETQRIGVEELLVFQYPQPNLRWNHKHWDPVPADYYPSEAVMGKALMHARLAFEANKRSGEVRNLKSGRLDGRSVGKRAPVGDERMFKKKRRPEDKDYFFAIGIDISGSTESGDRNPRILRAAFAQAQLLHRLGHRFAIYGMSGGRDPEDLINFDWSMPDSVWVLEVKSESDPWSIETQTKLAALRPTAENFDGHNIEFLRKVLDRSTATSRGIIYYTDGAMPAANAEEELLVLTNELLTCKKKGYAVLGVGINTDSPRQYGLDTVQVDSDEDLIKVTAQLGSFLTKN